MSGWTVHALARQAAREARDAAEARARRRFDAAIFRHLGLILTGGPTARSFCPACVACGCSPGDLADAPPATELLELDCGDHCQSVSSMYVEVSAYLSHHLLSTVSLAFHEPTTHPTFRAPYGWWLESRAEVLEACRICRGAHLVDDGERADARTRSLLTLGRLRGRSLDEPRGRARSLQTRIRERVDREHLVIEWSLYRPAFRISQGPR